MLTKGENRCMLLHSPTKDWALLVLSIFPKFCIFWTVLDAGDIVPDLLMEIPAKVDSLMLKADFKLFRHTPCLFMPGMTIESLSKDSCGFRA